MLYLQNIRKIKNIRKQLKLGQHYTEVKWKIIKKLRK